VTDAWSFRPGLIAEDASVKGFEVDGADGQVGTVEWACYAPGQSYLMVTVHHHLRGEHHVVPAAAVEAVDPASKRVRIRLTCAEVESLPSHHQDPNDPFEPAPSEQLELWNHALLRANLSAD